MVSFHSIRRQRGAAALFAAIGMVGVLAGAAFAIDLAQLHLAKRELHNMANLSALDASRAAGGCLAPGRDRQFEANLAANNALGRLGGELSWLDNGRVDLGRFIVDADQVRRFQVATEEESLQAFAFEVELTRPFPNLLLPVPGVDTANAQMRVRSVAAMAPVASFSIGSFLLNVGPSDQLMLNDIFETLFGTPPGLSVLSYQGLVDSSVSPNDIAEEIAGVSLEELLTVPIDVPTLLEGIADALFSNAAAVAGAAVDTLAALAPNDTVILGDVIGSPQERVIGAGEVTLNSLDLVRAVALDAAASVFQLTPGATVPGVLSTQVTVNLGQAAKPQAGPATQDSLNNYLTQASNTQGELELELQLVPVLGNPANLDLRLELAEATAELREIRCANRNRDQHEVDLGVETSVARILVENGPANPLIDLGVTQICWEGQVGLSGAYTDLLSYTGPFGADYVADNTQTVGSDVGLSLNAAMTDLLINSPPYVCGPTGPLIDPIVQPVLTALLALVGPVLTDTIDPVLMPLSRGLGVNFGGADVTVQDVTMQPPTLILSE